MSCLPVIRYQSFGYNLLPSAGNVFTKVKNGNELFVSARLPQKRRRGCAYAEGTACARCCACDGDELRSCIPQCQVRSTRRKRLSDSISVSSWRLRMLNRRTLILSAGKATVLLPAIAASHTFGATSTVDGNNRPHNVPSPPTPDELRCQALCIGRAALAQHFRESDT